MSCGTCRLCFGTKPPYKPKEMNKMSETTFATALDTLGQILPSDPGRDAIHLATYAVVSDERVFPGQHLGIIDGKATPKGELIGIVDPFLDSAVHPGQMFWLVLYPRTITSLRHVWTHPKFPVETVGVPIAAPIELPKKSEVDLAKDWMRDWAMQNMSYDYYGDSYGDGTFLSEENISRAYDRAINAGYDLHIGPYEDARDNINHIWWEKWELITGEKGQRGEYFSCSC